MRIRIFTVALLLTVHCAGVLADDDRERYNRRAAQTDMTVYRELNRSGNGFLTREEVKGDMRLGTRFDDIDINRDDIITPQEMQIYIGQTYGVLPAPSPAATR